MCVIVDANLMGKFLKQEKVWAISLYALAERGRQRLVVGGKLLEEYKTAGCLRHRLFMALESLGEKALSIVKKNTEDWRRCEAKTQELQDVGVLKSDDPHILALASIKNVRILATEDEDLGEDFRNREILPSPQGKLLPLGGTKREVDNFLRQNPCRV